MHLHPSGMMELEVYRDLRPGYCYADTDFYRTNSKDSPGGVPTISVTKVCLIFKGMGEQWPSRSPKTSSICTDKT